MCKHHLHHICIFEYINMNNVLNVIDKPRGKRHPIKWKMLNLHVTGVQCPGGSLYSNSSMHFAGHVPYIIFIIMIYTYVHKCICSFIYIYDIKCVCSLILILLVNWIEENITNSISKSLSITTFRKVLNVRDLKSKSSSFTHIE